MDNDYTVYMHVSPSGKRYIGITSMKPEKRWQNGKGYLKNKYFTRAIEKYGWENFKHIIIATDLSEEQAKEIEIELIRVWDSTNPSKGYNISLGGEGTNGINYRDFMTEEAKREHDRKQSEAMKGKSLSKETKRKISEALKGKTHTEEHNRKLSEANKGKNPLDYMTEEAKKERGRKISEANSGKNHPQAKSVITIINDKIFATFDYAKQGAEYFNCDNSDISRCCKGKAKSAGKYNGYKIVWRYIEIIEL